MALSLLQAKIVCQSNRNAVFSAKGCLTSLERPGVTSVEILLEELRRIEGVTHVSLVLRSELSEV